MQEAECLAPEWWPPAARKAWRCDSNRLFTRKGQDILIEAARVQTTGTHAVRIRSEEKLAKYLHDASSLKKCEECLLAVPRAQIFIIRPFYSWSRLEVSEACMAQMFAHAHVCANFFKCIQAFGQKSYAQDEGFSVCDMTVLKDKAGKPESVELCYILKYVEKHEDPGPTINPWSIRQVAVYQRFNLTSLESYQIFVRLSVAMQEVLYNALQKNPGRECEFISQWQNVHTLILKTLNANWRQYVNYLDEEVSKIVTGVKFDQVILSKVDPDAHEEKNFIESSLANVKRLQYLIDQTSRACHMLDLNSTVMKTLLRMSGNSWGGDSLWIVNSGSESRGETLSILEECQFHYKSASSLLGRVNSIAQHHLHLKLRDVIAMRNTEFMKLMTVATTQGNGALLKLSQKAVSESKSMKVITVVALVYVPASFVAEFLNMGYVSAAQGNGLVVSTTKGLWVYAMIAVPLVIVTMGVYFVFEIVNSKINSHKNRVATEKILDVV